MIIETKRVTLTYVRYSKLKNAHPYSRTKTIVVIKCDCCQSLFEREKGSMDHKRLSNNYFHVCSNCNSKQFAQKKGVERRQLWNISVDSDLKI
jgi:hypothetical protein